MPGFDPNILKPEEELSGFGLSEPDGDIFSLKEDYPQEVPQFENAPEPLIDETPVEELVAEAPVLDVDADGISQAPLIETPESGSVWDAFEDDAPAEQQAPVEEIADTVEEAPQEEVPVEPEDIDDDVSAFSEEEEAPEVINFEPAEETVIAEEVPEREEVIEEEDFVETPEDTAEPLDLGDDLKQMLEDELNRSKARKEEAAKEQLAEEPIEKSDPSEFQPVEKIAETEFIDITDIDKDEKERKAQIEKEAQQQKAETAQVIEEKKPKKKSKLLKNIGISAAAVVILTVLGIGVFQYWYYPNFMIEQPTIAEVTPDEKHEEVAHEEEHEDVAKHEDAHHEEQTHEETTHEEDAHANESQTDAPAEEHKEEEHATEPEAHNNVVEHKDVHKKEEPKAPVEVTQKPKEEPKHTPVTHKEKAQPKQKDVATHTSHKRTNKQEAQPKKTIEKEPEESDALYSVQIYASPSKDDAEAWLDNLKDKDVDNPRISTQKIRDVIWYRVRFGNFKSKDDARNAAMRYGFAQTWIDRIK